MDLMSKRRSPNGDFIKENFGSIWPIHVSAFTRLLTQMRAHFDGDLDLLLIMAAIGERTRPERWSPGLSDLHSLTRSLDGIERQFPINVQSVAEYAGIPRETVRRKVAILQKKGLVLRGPDGRLTVSAEAAGLLADATRDSLDYLEAIRAAFDAASGRPDPA